MMTLKHFRVAQLAALILFFRCRAIEISPGHIVAYADDGRKTSFRQNLQRKTSFSDITSDNGNTERETQNRAHQSRHLQVLCRAQLRQCERDLQDVVDSCPSLILTDQLFPLIGTCSEDLASCLELLDTLACPISRAPTEPLVPPGTFPTSVPSRPPSIAPSPSPSRSPSIAPSPAPSPAPSSALSSQPTVSIMPTDARFFQVPPNGTVVQARIVVVNDDFPNNLVWSINDITNDNREVYAGFGLPDTTVINITLTVGVEYEAIITDNFGDGFSVPDGSFTIEVDLEGNGGFVPLVKVEGNYGIQERVSFTVQGACDNAFLVGSTGSSCTTGGDCCTGICFEDTCIKVCPTGYRLSTDGATCEDVDECLLGIDSCGSTTCINTEGSFECFYSLPASGTTVNAAVVITSDIFPNEFGWRINDLSNSVNAIYSGSGLNGTTIVNISLTVGIEYEAIIFDTFGDGFCCPGGSFEVFADIGIDFLVPLVGVYDNYGSISLNRFTLQEICDFPGLAGFTNSSCDSDGDCCSGACIDGFCGFCPDGTVYNSGSSTCDDIDECALGSDNCGSFECINFAGGFDCFYKIPAADTSLLGRIVVDPDDFPGDLFWTFTDLETGDSISGTGNDTLITDVRLIVGNAYSVELFDFFGDGFCCPGGSLSVQVDLGNGVYIPVDSVSGNYGSAASLFFSVIDACDATLVGFTGSTCSASEDCCSGICSGGSCISSCGSGLTYDGTECVDIDECALGLCGSLACLNTLGSFQCSYQIPSDATIFMGTITIRTDFFPEEFSWTINDVTNNVPSIYRGTGLNGTTTIPIELTSGIEYEAVLEDSFGDGFPGGFFIVSVNIEGLDFELVEVRDNYGSIETVRFSIAEVCNDDRVVGNTGTSCVAGSECCSGVCLENACFTRCDSGFEIDSTFTSCIDIDECATGVDECGEFACVNTIGGYQCVFPPDGTVLSVSIEYYFFSNSSDTSFWAINDITNGGVEIISGNGQGSLTGPGNTSVSDDGEFTTIFIDTSLAAGPDYEVVLSDTSGNGNAAFVLFVSLGPLLDQRVYLEELNFGSSVSQSFSLRPDSICESLGSSDIDPTCSIGEACCTCTTSDICIGECPSGYAQDELATTCIDIDECTDGTDNCGTFECINTVGDFQCLYRVPPAGTVLNGRIDIIYDSFPDEVSWVLYDVPDFNTFVSGVGTNGTESESIPIELEVGVVYEVVVNDFFSDGFCCPSGSFTLSVELAPNSDIILFQVEGNYGEVANSTFSIAALCEGDAPGSNGSACTTNADCCSNDCSGTICQAI